MPDDDARKVPTITRIEHPKALVGKHTLSFTPEESTSSWSINLTQGELIDLWQTIGGYFNLAGMGEINVSA